MKDQPRLTGLIAATFSPVHDDRLDFAAIGPMVDSLIESGVSGLYVCGSTGEGVSLAADVRKSLAESYIQAADGRIPVIVQVGHNSLQTARELAAHAQQQGADYVSATCPSYFKIGDVETLVDFAAELAGAAPELPFYYYHIPSLTGSQIDMVEYLKRAGDKIPNLAGAKYTSTLLHEFLACANVDGGRFDILWGCDEMMLGALATGAKGFVGSTYNIAAPLYRRLIDAFEAGDIEQAREHQLKSVEMVRVILNYPFHGAMKAILRWRGRDFGKCMLPLRDLSPQQESELKERLEAIGFFDFAR